LRRSQGEKQEKVLNEKKASQKEFELGQTREHQGKTRKKIK